MSPHRYLSALQRYWWIVLVTTILGALTAFGLSNSAAPLYTATTTLYFSPSFGKTANDLNQGATYTQNQMLSFAKLAESPIVLKPVIEHLGLDLTTAALADTIAVTTPQNTVILEAAVTNADPRLAADIANQFAKSLTEAVTTIAPESTDKSSAVSVNIIAPASTPREPSSPDLKRNLIIGLLLGLIGGVLAILLRERLDDRVRTPELLAEVTDLPLLGTLPRPTRHGHRLGLTEDHRRMTARIAALVDPSRNLTLLVTSSTPGEGKSEVALGLAGAFAERDRTTLLIDGDLRRPAIGGLTGLAESAGLHDVLTGAPEKSSIVRGWESSALDVLPAGHDALNGEESVTSTAMRDLVVDLKDRYEVLVIDTAPVLSTADAALLGLVADGVIVVADSRRIVRRRLAAAIESLADSGVSVLGVVLTHVGRAHHDLYSVGHAHAADGHGAVSRGAESRWRAALRRPLNFMGSGTANTDD